MHTKPYFRLPNCLFFLYIKYFKQLLLLLILTNINAFYKKLCLRYRDNINKAAKLSLDQPMTGLARAVWWTEYVLRHKNTKHLRGTAAELPFYRYFLLDIISFVVVVFVAISLLIFKVFTYTLSVIKKLFNRTNKQKEL